MSRGLWCGAGFALAGLSLLLAASASGRSSGPAAATASDATRGGTFRILSTVDFDHIDPGLAYGVNSWQALAATQLRLYYYPMGGSPQSERIEPMAATALPRVSKDGKTYRIAIKPGFRFSNGEQVTVASFARAFARARSSELQSPAASFLGDVARVSTRANDTLVISMKVVAPDFLARLTLPFFSAVPASMPLDSEVDSGPLHSAGPYFFREWTKQASALAVRNPFWRNSEQPFESLGLQLNVDRITWAGFGGNAATLRLFCERNEADVCPFPPTQAKELADKHGIGKRRFFVRPTLQVWRIDMNMERPLFKGNPSLRKAVMHAIDRRFMTAQHGFLAGRRTDQYLPHGMPGFKEYDAYSLKGPNYATASQLAEGNTRGGKAVLYTSNRGAGPAVAQSVQFNLRQIGIEVEIKPFDPLVLFAKAGTRGEPFDLVHAGWTADYPDPSTFINTLFDGRRVRAENNSNTSYFAGEGIPNFARLLDEAYAASGAERLDRYAALDKTIALNGVPSATYMSGNVRHFLGPDVGCYSYSVQGGLNLVSICKR
jgi:peptide/nickel transport system substrate-binding protein